MKAYRGLGLIPAVAAILLCGCLNVKAPDKIVIGGGESEPVDSSRTPQISSVEEGRTELDRAYRAIRRLESQNAELEKDKDELKRERNQYKHERDDYRKQLEKSRGD